MRRWFGVAGLFGGLGLWVDFQQQWPVLAGIAAGAAWESWTARRSDPADSATARLPWGWWGLMGCVVSLIAYMLEYFPGQMDLRFERLHPVHAVAWGLVAQLLATWGERGPRELAARRRRNFALVVLGAAVVAIAVGLAVKGNTALPGDPSQARLTSSEGGLAAANVAEWLRRDGFSLPFVGTLLPVFLFALALVFLMRRSNDDFVSRRVSRVGVGAMLLPAAVAIVQLRAWNVVDGALLALAASIAAGPEDMPPRPARIWAWLAAMAAVAMLGVIPAWPSGKGPEGKFVLTTTEAQSLIERDLSHWLARRGGRGTIALAPPEFTSALIHYGSIRGIGTLAPENRDGIGAAIRIASAKSDVEALELIMRREITHIVIPSWDSSLEHYARMGTGTPEQSFMAVLQNWNLPRWLQPIPYALPATPGLENHHVTVLEVVDPQSEVVALARLAEYFLEMGRWEAAVSLRPRLRRYPSELSALIALGQIAAASSEAVESESVLKSIVAALNRGFDRTLPWDRRVSLATLLAQANRLELARAQAQRCAADANAQRLRRLSTATLYRLRRLHHVTGVEFPDSRLTALDLELLPADLRARIKAR